MRDIKDLIFYLSQTQEELKDHLDVLLRFKNYSPVNRDGFLYAKGDIPLLLVAHLDTEADEPPYEVKHDTELDKLYNPDGILGGDDRCGVYAIMEILEKYRPSVLFTEDEEKGLEGAHKAVIGVREPKYKYIIEIDRRGKDECVFYQCANIPFIDYVKAFGYRWEVGTNSDISVLGRVWDIAAVNVSAGYHNEHSNYEYVSISELHSSIDRIEKMIRDIDNAPYFDYQDSIGEAADFKKYVPTYKYKPNRKPLDNGGEK